MKIGHRLLFPAAAATVLSVAFVLMSWIGIELTLMTKMFILFVGLVGAFQCLPALLMFYGLLKWKDSAEDVAVDQTTR